VAAGQKRRRYGSSRPGCRYWRRIGELMHHAIMSMGDEKARLILPREIAQQLCRDAALFPAFPLKVQPRPQPVVVTTQSKLVKK
jgi:hypothetical protein